MKQLLQSYRTGELWLAEVPAPQCAPGSVVVRTRFSVISAGTEKMLMELAKKSLLAKARARPDLVKRVVAKARVEGVGPALRKALAKLDEPVSLGYSASGDVVEAGAEAGGLRPGDRVAVGGGGYATHAEFNFVPRNLCVRVPEGVSHADAAFATVGAVAVQGVRQASPLLGEHVVVIGLGLLGLLTVQVLKANGCAVLGVDLDSNRADLAKKLGADAVAVSDVEGASEAFTSGRGADAVIIAAASSDNGPIETAARVSRQKGRVVAVGLVGLDVPRDAFFRKELDLRLSMSYGPGRYDPAYEEGGADYPLPYVRFTEQRNMESFLYLVEQGKVTPQALVTHVEPFENALDAYAALIGADAGAGDRDADAKPLGVLLEYPTDAPLVRSVPLAPYEDRGTRETRRGTGSRDGTGPRQETGSRDGARPRHEARPRHMHVGFVGAGAFARSVLLPEIGRRRDVRLAGVCTATGRSAQQAAQRFGFAFATTDDARVLDDPDTDAVFVATRHDSHAALAAAALRAGKHVFVEKPLCIREEEMGEVEAALADARRAGRDPCLMVGFNRRFSPHGRALRTGFGERGRAPLVVSYRVNAGAVPDQSWVQDPAVGGGRIVGEACHFVDFCGAVVGSEPIAVWATAVSGDRASAVSPDSVVLNVEYACGSLASIQYLAGGHRDLPKERCEVLGGGRAALVDDFRATRFFGSGRGVRGRQDKGFAAELEAFFATCANGGPWPISWESMIATHRVCFAAVRSAKTGERVVVAR